MWLMADETGRMEHAMKSEITTETRQHRFGRSAMRVATAFVMALLVLGAMLHGAAAKPYDAGKLSKGAFTDACRSVGGSVSSKGNVVRCNYPNGTYESCKFKKGSTTTCNYVPIQTTTVNAQGQLSRTAAVNGTTIATDDVGPLEGMFAASDGSR